MPIIDIDEIKKSLPRYTPDKADEFQEASAKIANKIFDQELKKRKGHIITLMCGGSASEKTEYIDIAYRVPAKYFELERGMTAHQMIFDSTLSTIKDAKIKIKNIIKTGNIPQIVFILPDSLSRCFAAFNKRDRKIPEIRFYETHSGAREVILWIAKNYSDIEVFISYNYINGKEVKPGEWLMNERIDFETRKEMIDFLEKEQYSIEEIQWLVINNR